MIKIIIISYTAIVSIIVFGSQIEAKVKEMKGRA